MAGETVKDPFQIVLRFTVFDEHRYVVRQVAPSHRDLISQWGGRCRRHDVCLAIFRASVDDGKERHDNVGAGVVGRVVPQRSGEWREDVIQLGVQRTKFPETVSFR